MTLRAELLHVLAKVDNANPKSPLEVSLAGIVAFEFISAKGRSMLATLDAFDKLHREHFSDEARQDREDAERLDELLERSWKLEPFEIPTPGGDDADVGWRVIEFHRTKPYERIVAEVYTDDPRAAIDAARGVGGGG